MISTPHTRKVKTVKFNIYKIYKKYGKHSCNAPLRSDTIWNQSFPNFSFSVFTFSDPTPNLAGLWNTTRRWCMTYEVIKND